MIEEQQRADRRRQVEAIKSAGRDPKERGLLLHGLWACRAATGLTQKDLAATVGTSQGTIHDLERLLRGAYPKTIRRLCAALEVEPADLICAQATEED